MILLGTTLYVTWKSKKTMYLPYMACLKPNFCTGQVSVLKSVSMNILINNVAEKRILVSSVFQVRRGNRDDLGLSFIIFL